MRLHLLLFLLILCAPFAQAQVWPGDINQDGLADHQDLLYLGYAYGAVGPQRDSVSIEWEEQEILVLWDQVFPGTNGLNYAHADCNGDGQVNALDVLAIHFNYYHFNDFVMPAQVPSGVPGIDPGIAFDPMLGPEEPILEGTLYRVPINLGDTGTGLNDLNGLSLSIYYDPEAIEANSIFLEFENSWANPSGEELLQIVNNNVQAGRLDVAISRLGPDPIDGSGPFAELSFIIVDDVIDFLPADSLYVDIRIESAHAVDGDLESIPLVNDTLWMKVVSPDYFVTQNRQGPSLKQFKVFPNPAADYLYIHNPGASIESVELLDQTGRLVLVQATGNEETIRLDVRDLPGGVYYLRAKNAKTILSRKLVINRQNQ